MFGSHLSIAGGMYKALARARELDMDCVQVFTKNQRQWRVSPLKEEELRLWQQHRRETGLKSVVSHDSYLINLASPASDMREKSIALFREELLRCEALDIPFLVTHPGAHMGTGEEAGLAEVARSLSQLHRELPNLRTVTCLEITAGQGTSLGHRLEHLARIIELTHEPERLAVCLDTAHLLASGYDLTNAAGTRNVLAQVDSILGIERVKVLHLNDSKAARGSHVDRHEHIGQGYVALEAFEVIVNQRHFKKIPKIMETPKEAAPGEPDPDTINLAKLRSLLH